MGAPDLRTRLALIGVAALVALGTAGVPAQAQTSSEPTEVVDVSDFADRAQRWSEARRRAREEALRRAEQLANQARTTTTTQPPPTTAPPPPPPPTTTTTTAPPTTTTDAPTTTSEDPAVKHPIPDGTTGAQWHALRQCESTQNYRAISVSGRYRGAYQFSIRTWDWVAGKHWPELVGVDPIDASPSDQDKMAYKLYEINGWDPWPTCKKRLPS